MFFILPIVAGQSDKHFKTFAPTVVQKQLKVQYIGIFEEILAMPERKRFFSIDIFPNRTRWWNKEEDLVPQKTVGVTSIGDILRNRVDRHPHLEGDIVI